MPCGPECACLGTEVECLAVVAPAQFGFFKDWCASGDPVKRMHVLNRSRMGFTPPAAVVRDAPISPAPAAAASPPMLAGDFVAALAKHIGADRAAKWVAKNLGEEDCGCAARAAALNRLDSLLRRFLSRS